ncbi:hypothetical protein ACFQZE_18365 [Paenibacillus sp. GCM10027627]
MEQHYTFETIARILGDTVRRWEVVEGLETFTPENDRTYSKYPRRVKESEIMKFFHCDSIEEFRKLRK